MRKKLLNAIEYLNNAYGRGAVVSVRDGIVTCKKQYGIERVKFRFDGRTLFFRGHQKMI